MKIDRILLVDDDSISNFVSTEAIKKIGFADEIIVKTNARDALVYLEKECKTHNKYPDLILLDLKMPDMDGFEFIAEFEMACDKINQNIVVVILTSSRDGDDMVRLRRLGNYYLMSKPLTPEKLVDIHHRYFRFRRQYF
jgi:CheY-like chemotaxis protein